MTTTTKTAAISEQLIAAGGKPWTSATGAVRVYFNDLADLFGLGLSFYGTGNINSASLDGLEISNSYAKKILADLGALKVWVNEDGTISVKKKFRTTLDYDYDEIFADAIVSRLAS